MKKLIYLTLMFCSCTVFTADKTLLEGLGLDSAVAQDEKLFTCNPLPASAPPAQFSGGEGTGPLPLPAVTLRRSEKKNPPRPPVMVVKIDTGNGPKDWNTNPNDVDALLKWLKAEMNIDFSVCVMTLDDALNKSEKSPTRLVDKKK